ncbi:hypothetical protein FB451DRAFT_1164953 [Mycena latifolia]|nr:hypothetical protein FB451DRAFT_1164953 [Mycena latifolia]
MAPRVKPTSEPQVIQLSDGVKFPTHYNDEKKVQPSTDWNHTGVRVRRELPSNRKPRRRTHPDIVALVLLPSPLVFSPSGAAASLSACIRGVPTSLALPHPALPPRGTLPHPPRGEMPLPPVPDGRISDWLRGGGDGSGSPRVERAPAAGWPRPPRPPTCKCHKSSAGGKFAQISHLPRTYDTEIHDKAGKWGKTILLKTKTCLKDHSHLTNTKTVKEKSNYAFFVLHMHAAINCFRIRDSLHHVLFYFLSIAPLLSSHPWRGVGSPRKNECPHTAVGSSAKATVHAAPSRKNTVMVNASAPIEEELGLLDPIYAPKGLNFQLHVIPIGDELSVLQLGGAPQERKVFTIKPNQHTIEPPRTLSLLLSVEPV